MEPTQDKRVLVVDDDDSIRMMVERVLRRERYQVDSARDGSEAIEKLDQGQYDTVLLDLMMPRVDGHGVLRHLEQQERGKKPWVILMTANLHGAAESRAKKHVLRVLPKPFDLAQLISHVRESHSDGEPTPEPTEGARLARPEDASSRDSRVPSAK